MPILIYLPEIKNVDRKHQPEYIVDHIISALSAHFESFKFNRLCMFTQGRDFPDKIKEQAFNWNTDLQTALDESILNLKKNPSSPTEQTRTLAALHDFINEPVPESNHLIVTPNGIASRLSKEQYQDIETHPENYVYCSTGR